MAHQIISTSTTDGVINVNALMASVESPLCGAVVTFSGNVRLLDNGREVKTLKYEIHPTTDSELKRVAEEVCLRHDILFATIIHRFGNIPIGEAALTVAISAPHRQAAFAACTELIDEIKVQVPVWKYQEFTDDTFEWINSG